MYEQYHHYWLNKLKKRQTTLSKRKKELRDLARKCTQFLTENYNVNKVYLVGSLARKDKTIHESSDIDLVVFGLAPEIYFRVLAELIDLLPKNTDVNLIPYENANDRMKYVVRNEGEILFEK